jgi:hypothetical protein
MEQKIVKDENGLVTDVLVNGKPVKRGSMRGLRKAQTAPYWILHSTPVFAHNPFSGELFVLKALEGSIYDFCMNWMQGYEQGTETLPIQVFDDMKYFLLELNPKAYMGLID